MAVHLALAPPDGFDAWTADEWGAWLESNAPDRVLLAHERGDWFVFLYMARVHGGRAEKALAPFLERLILERPIRSSEVEPMRDAFQALERTLDDVPTSRLWTGTQFYSADELYALIERVEGETGKTGLELSVADLWRPLFRELESVFEQAEQAGRGVYFGHV